MVISKQPNTPLYCSNGISLTTPPPYITTAPSHRLRIILGALDGHMVVAEL